MESEGLYQDVSLCNFQFFYDSMSSSEPSLDVFGSTSSPCGCSVVHAVSSKFLKFRSFTFTFMYYTDEDLLFLKTFGGSVTSTMPSVSSIIPKYMVFAECMSERGRKYIQGFVLLWFPAYFSSLVRQFGPRCFLSVAVGLLSDHRSYLDSLSSSIVEYASCEEVSVL